MEKPITPEQLSKESDKLEAMVNVLVQIAKIAFPVNQTNIPKKEEKKYV